jgi:nucleoside-diphosphate-sugar epimerase
MRSLILGCGYLGSRLLVRLKNLGYTCDVLTRNSHTASQLQNLGADKVCVSLLAESKWHSEFDPTRYQLVVVCVGASSSDEAGYRASYIDGCQSVVNWGKTLNGLCVYTSSISVYGDQLEGWIDETTPPEPANWRGSIILESEKLISMLSNQVTLRLGGIYGKDRTGYLTSILESNTGHLLNLIHVEDAVSAIVAIGSANTQRRRVYNLTDGSPISRKMINEKVDECYKAKGMAAPVADPTRKQRSVRLLRRISSSQIQKDFAWKPHFRDATKAIPELID